MFKYIDINSKSELEPYFKLADYEASEYCFSTIYMWRHLFNAKYYIENDFAIILLEYEKDVFSIIPLCTKDKLSYVVDYALNYIKNEYKIIQLKGVNEEIAYLIKVNYKEKFIYEKERDLFDYIYDAESLRTLSGRKNKKKRNHVNTFLNLYKNRYEYKLLDKENFEECIEFLNVWEQDKENIESSEHKELDEEVISIKEVFENYDKLKDKVKIAGVYIDNKLESFTIGEEVNENIALIHIEKANQNIKGLYQYINQQFLLNEFPKVKYVNREEDLGIDGLREAKLSYHPCKFIEKYSIKEV
nr:phosphatidylglycerol lysyltransferase domain-containing protein [uncultured Romboutsia sp.]